MKNKKLIQLNNRQKHRALLRNERKTEPAFEREKPTKNEKPRILIVCEGKNTEPSYFRQFRLSSATIEAIGEGFNTLSLVKKAIEISRKNQIIQVKSQTLMMQLCLLRKMDLE